MAIKTINPYLFFNGAAADAVAFYQQALGATVVRMSRYGDAPGGGVPAEHANLVMHAHLEAAGGTLLISDATRGEPVKMGGNVSICLQYDGTADVDRHFAAMSDGGTVVEPLTDTFWGARFGMLVDKFGINWMFNAELAK